jgi:hypothetical protein
MATSGTVDRDSWKGILVSAVAIFDGLKSRGLGMPGLTLGGGTVLMFRFEHRLSKDIDFFIHDVQWLSFLTPRLNDVTAAMVESYEEQANSVKLVLPDGDIDFIAAGRVTSAEPQESLDFGGYSFPLETTEEILAKKLLYRPESFKPRDVFDLAVAVMRDPGSAARALAAAASKQAVLERRLQHLSGLGADDLSYDILPIGDVSPVLQDMTGIVRRFVRDHGASSNGGLDSATPSKAAFPP